jgi:hypothetical protein
MPLPKDWKIPDSEEQHGLFRHSSFELRHSSRQEAWRVSRPIRDPFDFAQVKTLAQGMLAIPRHDN